jgi:hypothetical protein
LHGGLTRLFAWRLCKGRLPWAESRQGGRADGQNRRGSWFRNTAVAAASQHRRCGGGVYDTGPFLVQPTKDSIRDPAKLHGPLAHRQLAGMQLSALPYSTREHAQS